MRYALKANKSWNFESSQHQDISLDPPGSGQ